ncbi:MAG: cell division protein FtsQ/DivIB [Akkermansia sp.]
MFNSEQAFSVMGIGPQDNIFSIDAAELEQRLKKCPAIRRASVKRQISSNPTLLVDIDARIPVAWIDCPELGIHPGDATYGALADKEGVIFPCMEQVTCPIQGRTCPPSRSGRPVPANSATASASGNWKRP